MQQLDTRILKSINSSEQEHVILVQLPCWRGSGLKSFVTCKRMSKKDHSVATTNKTKS